MFFKRMVQYFPKRIALLAFVLILAGCRASNQSPTNTPLINSETETNPTYITKAEFIFWVEIPENTPAGDLIQIVFYDEITGKEINPTTLNLRVVNQTQYGIAIQAEIGSILKYAYQRISQDDLITPEYTSTDEKVYYRMAYIGGPGEAHDIVARWEDTPIDKKMGRISGTLIDSETGLPISNIMLACAGQRAISRTDGSFTFSQLIEGEHEITAYARDGRYFPFKQIAKVQANAETPAQIQLIPAPKIAVTFNLTVPENTPSDYPIKIAGNIDQLGNTFVDLNGGMSILSNKMPKIHKIADFTYQVTLDLYGGTFLRYKYTFGDGFWNSEQSDSSPHFVRTLQLPPNQNQLFVYDVVQTWNTNSPPILFNATAPFHTPATDQLFIQFKFDDWTAPLPMKDLGQNKWEFLLFPPTSNLDYRYCRNGICGDQTPIAAEDTIRNISFPYNEPIKLDTISEWHLLAPRDFPITILNNPIESREAGFIAGVMVSPNYNPIWEVQSPQGIIGIQELNANTVIFTPQQQMNNLLYPYISLSLEKNQSPSALITNIQTARALGINAQIFPQVQIPTDANEWWESARKDSHWWQIWWQEYRTFILLHADIAQRHGAETLILGGDWLAPLFKDESLELPDDFTQRWDDLIQDIRFHYEGNLGWDSNYDQDFKNLPPFIDQFDRLYIHWGTALGTWSEASLLEMQEQASHLLSTYIKPYAEESQVSIILVINYPSTEGGLTNCITTTCLPLETLSLASPSEPDLTLDLREQMEVYNAVLAAVNEADWLDGFISEDYYLPVGVADLSTSVHGKPTEDILKYWFAQFLTK